MEKELRTFFSEYKRINASYTLAFSTMYFDMATIAPSAGIPYRNEMMSILAGEAFAYQMNPEHLKKLETLMKITKDEKLKKELALYFKELDINRNLPKDVYIRFKKTVADSEEAWQIAKERDDYKHFKQHLIQVIKAQKEVISYVEKDCSDYDYLLDRYQSGMNREKYDAFFSRIKTELLPLIQRIQKEGRKIDDSLLYQDFDLCEQEAFMQELNAYMQVDPTKCYMGTTEHPFTDFFSANEVRITTHYYKDNVLSAIFSTIHEYGHALYSLQVDETFTDTAFKNDIGFAMHESQSRLMENHIGRNKAFWEYNYPKLQAHFPKQLQQVSLDQFMTMINASKPSLIRTEADELTYPIHILIRYELEKEIFDGKVDYEHLDTMWNDKYEEYLGIRPTHDKDGILQDMHWGAADLGYFATYALGSAYAAQFYHAMQQDIDVEDALRKGEFKIISDWLKENVHRYGASLTADEILLKASGEPFNPEYYIDYLKNKFMKVYGLSHV